jgi:drug/metabolite transporter (DMT)-like permease
VRLTHRGAVAVMVTAALLWSTAGVVTRQLDAARSFEVTFWRSAFNALSLVALLAWRRGPAVLWRSLAGGGRALWLSGLCWSVMFTAFMVGITLTTVANVLVTMALAPLATALLARAVLGDRLPARTWAAIVCAGLGIVWMYGSQVRTGAASHWAGTAVALAVPLAAAVNWTLLQRLRQQGAVAPDLMPAVLVGAVLSAALTLPAAWPLATSRHDLLLLAGLGLGQLAVPCLLAVAAARVLGAAEVALLGLLEVIFGVAWVWMSRGEEPTPAVIGGGLLVLGALAANELLALRRTVPREA